MKDVIFKYVLMDQVEEIEVHGLKKVLSAKNQDNSVVLYVQVDLDLKETKKIKVVQAMTGQECNLMFYEFIDTVMLMNGSFVSHVYVKVV